MTHTDSSAVPVPASIPASVPAPVAGAAASDRRRPSTLRRLAVVATGFLASALPLLWGAGSLLMLLTGTEADHRFHQVTGQGVLLAVLWLAGIVPLVRAGWTGVRPATAAGLGHLAFVAASVLTAGFVSGAGVVAVAAVVVVTAALLWWALPLRPRLRGAFGGLDPVVAPLAMLGAALFTPFVLGERTLQAAMADEHAEMTHYFDMAWVSIAVVALAVVAALSPAARRLAVLSGVSTAVIGLSRMVLTGDVTWSATAVALGLLTAVAAAARARASRENR